MARSMVTTYPGGSGAPRWAGDYGGRDNLIPGGFKADPAQFPYADTVVVVVAAAGAAQNAVAVPVDALTGAIPAGTVLDFGGVKIARVTVAAAVGAVSLTTAAIPTALVDNDAATYPGALGSSTNGKYLPSGSILGRTLAERDASTAFGPAADADDEVFITYFDVDDLATLDDVEFYRPNNVVYENFLPQWATISAAVKAKVRAAYLCTQGAP